jgi:hypothetical protein
MTDARRRIRRAESLLPGVPAPEGKEDARWQAIIEVGLCVESEPEPLWEFAAKWGAHPQKDLRQAIATCLLEDLLEFHFATIFPRVRQRCFESRRFAETFSWCWKFGEAAEPSNARRFDLLQAKIRRSRLTPRYSRRGPAARAADRSR